MTLATIALERSGPHYPTGDLTYAREVWGKIRLAHGMRQDGSATLLTPPSAQTKIRKNARPTWSLTLTAGREHGLCVNDAACRDVCVVQHGGKGDAPTVVRAREARTAFLVQYPELFADVLADDIRRMARKGIMCGRPNANSDVAWERVYPWLPAMVADLGGYLYDYTKRRDRVGYMAPNYRVTYSATRSTSPATVDRILAQGDTVTAVFPARRGEPLPSAWLGHPVVDGDETDDRYIDPAGVVVGLRRKGMLTRKNVDPTSHPLIVKGVNAP